jgi:hypothetical protein
MDPEILSEMADALEDHGAPPDLLRRAREARQLTPDFMAEAYAALEKLGAHRWLLATIGSWRDGMSDAELLEQLTAINAGTFDFQAIASTSSVARKGRK